MKATHRKKTLLHHVSMQLLSLGPSIVVFLEKRVPVLPQSGAVSSHTSPFLTEMNVYLNPHQQNPESAVHLEVVGRRQLHIFGKQIKQNQTKTLL